MDKILIVTNSFKDRDLEGFFSGWLNKKLALYLIKRAGYKAGDKVSACDSDRLYKISRNCSFKIKSGGNYREAQLMCGGIPLNEVDEDLQSEKAKGVYLIGELLDVAGECGGYNLHFALSCAFTVSKALIRRR